MRGQVERAQQSALLGGIHDKKQGALRLFAMRGVSRVSVRQRHYAHGARAVVVGAMPDVRAANAVVIVVTAKQNRFRLELGVAALEQTHDVVRFAGADRRVAVM